MSLPNNPCKECPFRKDSMKGYFGGNDPVDYRSAISDESLLPCHTRSKYNKETGFVIRSEIVPCVGRIMAQMNSCKRPSSLGLKAEHDLFRAQHTDNSLAKEREQILSIFDWDSHHNKD